MDLSETETAQPGHQLPGADIVEKSRMRTPDDSYGRVVGGEQTPAFADVVGDALGFL